MVFRMNRLRGSVLFAFVTFLFVAHSVPVDAAETTPFGSLIVRPAKAELTLLPGEEKTVTLSLANGTTIPLSIEISYEDITAVAQEAATDDPIRLMGSEQGEYSLQPFIHLPVQTIDLLSGKAIDVPVTVRIPKETLPEGRYGSVVFSFRSSVPGADSPANVAVRSRVAVPLYVRVSGVVHEEGRLLQFGLFNNKTFLRTPTPSTPLRFQVAYANTGDVHLNPYGRIIVRGVIGDDHVLGIDPWVVLPGATRMREIDLIERLAPGIYTATLEQNRGYSDVIDTSSVRFVVLPGAQAIILSVIGLILLMLLVRRSLRLSRHSLSSS